MTGPVRRPRRATLGVAVLLLVAVPGAGGALAKPAIEGLETRIEGDRVLVSFDVVDALREETLERIHSGLPVSFRHKIEILRRRAVPLWPARELARTRVITEATYDSLTRQYSLLRRLEIRSKRKRDEVEPDEVRRSTESLDEMKRWMTELREIPVYDPTRALPDDGLKLRVESSLGRHFVLWVFPATIDATAERRLDP